MQNTDDRKRFLTDAIGIDARVVVVLPNIDSVFTAIEKQAGVYRDAQLPPHVLFANSAPMTGQIQHAVVAHKKDAPDEVIHAFVNNMVRMQVE